MKTWEFTLELTGIEDPTAELAEALFRAGCDDTTLSKSEGKLWLDFDREAESLEEAVTTATNDVRKAGERLGVPLDVKGLMMKYRGYIGIAKSDEEIIHGEVFNARDVITFQGSDFAEAEKAFQESVRDYLAFCESRGEDPNKPLF